MIAFNDKGMPIMDARIHAASELLATGALKNRNVIPQGPTKGVAVIYEWTELGIRMLIALHAASAERARELHNQISSVRAEELPPPHLRDFPPDLPVNSTPVDMKEAVKVDLTSEAKAEDVA